ncbi:MAG: DHH family phosphoesterase, partial [Spirochaetota bacterium]
MAQKVYITGHRNPDMDSVCSAYCYAAFKRHIDPQTEYIPIRCGHLNDSAKGVFEEIEITPPAFMKDLRPRVGEVTNPPRDYLYLHDPVYTVVNILHSRTVSIVPIFQENGEYAGLISVDDVNGLFMKENSTGRPRYTFRVDNFSCVVEGFLLKRGKEQEFETFLMTGAMPYEVSLHRIGQLLPEKPVLVVGMRRDLVDYAVEQQLPAIILTGYTAEDEIDYDFSGYEGSVYVSYLDTAETIRLIRLSLPINNIIPRNIPQLQATDLFDDALAQLLESGYRGLPVFDKNEFMGTVTRRCFIKRPKKQVILVDHNEISQSVRGIEDSDVIEILDHHRLAAEKTRHPIYIFAAPVGSTCTLVYQHFERHNIPIEYSIAILLLAGILSDT